MNKKTVNIELLGKTYPIKCPEHEVETLQKAAQLIGEKMHAARETAHLLSHDKIAVITSLNLAHQMLLLEQNTQHSMQNIQQRLHDLQGKVESALSHHAQMELVSAD